MVKCWVLIFSLICSVAYAQPTFDPTPAPLNIQTQDGATSAYPYSIKVTNGTLVDNGDGTVNLTTGGGGGGGGSAAGNPNDIQYNDGATFGASDNLTFHATSSVLTATGNVIVTNTATTSVLSVKNTSGNYYLPYYKGSSGQVITLQTDGTAVWQSQTSSDIDDLTRFVPYTGATGSVILGNHDLTSSSAVITYSATTNVLKVNVQATSPVISITKYEDFTDQVSDPPHVGNGFARLYALTTQGFTRLQRDNEAPTDIVLGRDNVFIARNTSGAPMVAGKAVYVTGSTGNVPNISLARSDSITTLPAVGITLDPIGINAFGQIMKLGIIQNINTSAFNSGDEIFVSPTSAGDFVNVRPPYPYYVQRVGSVLVSGVGNGSYLITIAPFIGTRESGTNNTSYSFAGNVYSSGSVIIANTATASVFSAKTTSGNYYLPYSIGSTGQVITLQTDGTTRWQTPTATGGGHTIQDEGVSLPQETFLNFTGAGVTASDAGGKTVVNIPGGGTTTASGSVMFTFAGGNSAIATGASAWAVIPYNATITEWGATCYSTSPTFVATIYKSDYTGFTTNYMAEISGSEQPTITSGIKGRDTYLTTWTTSVSAGDYIYAKVTGVDTATQAVVYIGMTKS